MGCEMKGYKRLTNEEKQIEEMAQAIFDYVDTKNMGSVYICGNKTIDEAKPFLHNTGVAEFMYEKGYRKQSDTAREIAEMLKAAKAVVKVHFEAYDELIENIAAEYGVEEKE